MERERRNALFWITSLLFAGVGADVFSFKQISAGQGNQQVTSPFSDSPPVSTVQSNGLTPGPNALNRNAVGQVVTPEIPTILNQAATQSNANAIAAAQLEATIPSAVFTSPASARAVFGGGVVTPLNPTGYNSAANTSVSQAGINYNPSSVIAGIIQAITPAQQTAFLNGQAVAAQQPATTPKSVAAAGNQLVAGGISNAQAYIDYETLARAYGGM